MTLQEIEVRKAEILEESATADLETLKLLNEEMDDLNRLTRERLTRLPSSRKPIRKTS